MKTRKEKVKIFNGETAIITMDENNHPVSVKVFSINRGEEILVKDQRDNVIEVFENVIFEFPVIGKKNKNNKIIIPRQYVAFVEENFLNIGLVTQYVRAGIRVGDTLITRAYRAYGAYPFGKKVRGRLSICYCYDAESNIRIILNYSVYRNQIAPEGEVEKVVSFKIRPTLGKTIFSMAIPGEKNMILIEKTKKEKTFPALCA